MRLLATVALVILASGSGCAVRLDQSASDGNVVTGDDASGPGSGGPGGSGADGGSIFVTGDAHADASSCPTGRVVYLDFDGETLTQAATSDATANQAVWMGVATASMPPFRDGAPDRATQIQAVVAQVTLQLAVVPSIKIVTERPFAGPYVLIGFGGSNTTVDVPYTDAVNHLDCGDTVKNDIGWIFEDVATTQAAANFAVGAIAFGLGVTGTTDPNDCMCGWLTACSASATTCTLSTSITAELDCPNETDPQNEVAVLDGFCQ